MYVIKITCYNNSNEIREEKMDTIKEYIKNHQKVLGIYSFVIVLFYIFNFVFFRKTVDVPADLIFSILFIIFVPGIVTLVTLLRENLDYIYTSKTYFRNILVPIIVPIIISMVFALIYQIIRINLELWQPVIWLHGIGISISMIGVMIALEFKIKAEHLMVRVLILLGIIISYFIINIFIENITTANQDMTIYYLFNAVYFYVVPVILLTTYYRKKMVH
jgi:hypothetical protein